jgi:hypothetical protein
MSDPNDKKDETTDLIPVIDNSIYELEDYFDLIEDGCPHLWSEYNGLFETFEYCKLCDEKRLK